MRQGIGKDAVEESEGQERGSVKGEGLAPPGTENQAPGFALLISGGALSQTDSNCPFSERSLIS